MEPREPSLHGSAKHPVFVVDSLLVVEWVLRGEVTVAGWVVAENAVKGFHIILIFE